MKKYLLVCVIMLACFANTSFAQLQVSRPATQKNSLLQIPMVHITPVSNLFVPVHIDQVKPFVVSLDRTVQANQKQAACNHFKKLKPALTLKAARLNSATANLQWETKYAFYASGFEIERSQGDSLHFETINFAAVSETTAFTVNYELPDANEYSGFSFYRVKQRNGDKGFAYSNIVSLKGFTPVAVKADPIAIKLYPIPAANRIWIDVAPKQIGNAVIMVYNAAGKLLLNQPTTCTERSLAIQSIDISRLAAGVYQLRILLPDKAFVIGKFIKE